MKSGLAASAAALLPLRPTISGQYAAETALPHPELFIFDERFPDAVAASRFAMQQGVRLASTRLVFTSLWYEELDLRWRAAPRFVAGVTSDRTLQTLETLALDRRMRVLDRDAIDGDELVSWTLGPAPRRRDLTFDSGA